MAIIKFERKKNTHYCLRARFKSTDQKLVFKMTGRSQFIYYIDGKFEGDGPSRFPSIWPEYTNYDHKLLNGDHILVVFYEFQDLYTRLSDSDLDPFFLLEIYDEVGYKVDFDLRYERIHAFDEHTNQKINEILGFLEWQDTSKIPEDILDFNFDDSNWLDGNREDKLDFTLHLDSTRPVKNIEFDLKRIGSGYLTEEFGYERDFVQARFSLRRLRHLINPPQGVWARYDLGAVKLVRPALTIDCPKGASVEFALSETLTEAGRVTPFVSLTTGMSANMVHFSAKGGKETFMPLTPLGGRYLEVHVVTEPSKVKEIEFLKERAYWRTFFDKEIGTFRSNDKRLNDIWDMGVLTLRSCTEDVVTDCPVRERGQWTGDSAKVGLMSVAIAYGDMQVIRKSLLQASRLANPDGVIPALYPGHIICFVTYSLLWVTGLLDYYKNSGDLTLLVETYGPLAKFINYMKETFDFTNGLFKKDGAEIDLGFIDWGFESKRGNINVPVACMYYMAVEAFTKIQSLLGQESDTKQYKEKLYSTIRGSLDNDCFQSQTMLLRAGILKEEEKKEVISKMKAFILDCFPNREDRPRLYSPTIFEKQIITPYFLNFALPALIENGEIDFVLEQIKVCWGYMLDLGETTCLEVFDTRWSHCHQWSGAPSWILSHYGLGLAKDFTKGINHFNFVFCPGSIEEAKGLVPLPSGKKIKITWNKDNYILLPQEDIHIHFKDGSSLYCKRDEETFLSL